MLTDTSKNKSVKEKNKNYYPPEYCPECGYDRSKDEEKHKCSNCGSHTPPQDFPPFLPKLKAGKNFNPFIKKHKTK